MTSDDLEGLKIKVINARNVRCIIYSSLFTRKLVAVRNIKHKKTNARTIKHKKEQNTVQRTHTFVVFVESCLDDE